MHFVGEKGSLFWDFGEGAVRVYLAEEDKWEVYRQPLKYDTNQMFIDELSYFLSCVQNNQNTFNDIEEAARTLKLALAVKESSETNKPVELRG